jgi:glycogen synthase
LSPPKCSASNYTTRDRSTRIATRQVIFLASENGALPGGKVGGVGDVVRDLPRALALQDWRVRIATPSYGVLHRLSGSCRTGNLSVPFRGEHLQIEVWEVPTEGGVETIVLHHALFEEQGAGRIYFGDEPDRPFATDATKFALFCAAAASWVLSLEDKPDVVHLHDWHAALYLVVVRYRLSCVTLTSTHRCGIFAPYLRSITCPTRGRAHSMVIRRHCNPGFLQ